MKGPKILFLDIETSPMLGYVWGLWENNVALNQLHTDWQVLCWAAKWQGEKLVCKSQKGNKSLNDKSILRPLWKLLDGADIVVGQNSKKFDIKKLNARFITHGMQPPSSFKQIDTLVLAKKHFGFTSNKLEYMTNLLCTKYKKLTKRKYEGFELWKECLAGNKSAWTEMEKYNRIDVLSLEELYNKLIPWDNSVNFNVYTPDDMVCTCGSQQFKKIGFFYSSVGKFQRHRCTKCGSEFRSRKVEKSNLKVVGTTR